MIKMDINTKIKEIEEELKNTKYNKATQHHIGRLKARLAVLKQKNEQLITKKSGKKSLLVKKSGVARVCIVGYPSVGKSTLLNALTDANSKIGDYDFTTVHAIPGMLKYKGTSIQLLDLPGIIDDASKNKGMGKEVISAIRTADIIIILLDIFNLQYKNKIVQELYKSNIRLNEKQPNITISKKPCGGIVVNSTLKLTKIDTKMIKDILHEFGYINSEIVIRDDIDENKLIDFLAGNRAYIKSFVVVNKVDIVSKINFKNILEPDDNVILISAKTGYNIEKLKNEIYNYLEMIRVYLKKNGEIDYCEPLIIKKGEKIKNVCERIHKDITDKFKFALVWGKSVKYSGQRVGLNHMLYDEDIVTIITDK